MKLDLKKSLTFVLIAFVLLSIWDDPGGTAEAFSAFLGDVGGWLEDLIDKATEFFRGLT